MQAVQELGLMQADVQSAKLGSSDPLTLAKNREWLEWLKVNKPEPVHLQSDTAAAYYPPNTAEYKSGSDSSVDWHRKPASETLLASSNETVLYQEKKQTGRKIVGWGLIGGGLIYAGVNALAGRWGHVVGGIGAAIVGNWVLPKEGQKII